MSGLIAREATAPAGRLPAILQPLRLRDVRLVWAGESIWLLGATHMFVAAGGVVLATVVAGLLSGAQHRLD